MPAENWNGAVVGTPLNPRVTVRVRLPMHGIADSLNVSATAAVLFYEARRQRELSPRSVTGG